MVQMSTKRIFADGYGMGIFGISRRYVADIYFRFLRYCTRYIKPHESDTTMCEKKYLPFRNHIFLFRITCKLLPTV